MKYRSYEYRKGNVTLSFKFEENEKLEGDKKDFLQLLAEASNELLNEKT